MSTCVHCGRTCGDYLGGLGKVGDAPLCHPNEPGRPDCYHLVTVYSHRLVGCPTCPPAAEERRNIAERVDPMTFPDGYYAAPDPDEPGTITCWKRHTHPTKKSRKTFRPWQRGARYGPNKNVTRADVPTDPAARTAFLAEIARTSEQWSQQVFATIAADLDAARRLFASFTTHCWQCGQTLRDPESKLHGRGPDCRGAR